MSSKRKRTSASAATTATNATTSATTTPSDAPAVKQARVSRGSRSVKGSATSASRRGAAEREEQEDADDHSTTVGDSQDKKDMEVDDNDNDNDEDGPSTTDKRKKKAGSSSSSNKKKNDDLLLRVPPNANTVRSSSSSSSLSSGSSTPAYSYPINPPPVGRPVRIYCDGIYDLFHFGHAKALQQAKEAFPDVYLLVGVCDDQATHSRKGKTVMTDKERYESVRHCKWVDEVIEAAPWVINQAFLDKHQIDYVAHDDIPYKSVEADDVYAFVKSQGRFLPTQRTDGVSTSDLITRIVKDYDQYLRRNLERGVTAKELGIGFFKEQEVKLKKSAQDIRASIRQNWHGTKDELKNEISVLRNDLRQTLNVWEDKSQELIKDFSRLFGADSVMTKIFRRRNKGKMMIQDGVKGSSSNGSSSGSGSSISGSNSVTSASQPNSAVSSRLASPEGSDFDEDYYNSQRSSPSSPTSTFRSDEEGDKSPRSDLD
ncbi:choline-phosphate cytidylyltransferase [Actinomortierella ambigua]|uniref:choline-phosphate cytidylyltransferase n=1 Tax=Actinomortierella ambigua TaxID=1343610 RepID=A0A9P6UA46_9FUNG|nr:choline-phosphate cytidylyltransferase [Actinomortierella ambigua]